MNEKNKKTKGENSGRILGVSEQIKLKYLPRTHEVFQLFLEAAERMLFKRSVNSTSHVSSLISVGRGFWFRDVVYSEGPSDERNFETMNKTNFSCLSKRLIMHRNRVDLRSLTTATWMPKLLSANHSFTWKNISRKLLWKRLMRNTNRWLVHCLHQCCRWYSPNVW
jgi:hypothetical protein